MQTIDYTQFVFAFLFVIGLIWATAVGAKKLGLDKKIRGVSGNAESRLQILEVMYLDPKRKLTLVRADKQEYLLLLSAESAMLVDKLEGKTDAVA